MAKDELKTDVKPTVKMKFTGHFSGTQKIVQLPIPLIANSQKLDQTIVFSRQSNKQGPAFGEVPLEWAGALMDVGGNWQLVDKLTPELKVQIVAAQEENNERMRTFALENQAVDA